ncbi:hypothetical protein G9C85_16405 [Halorubellus sp. JP-L1]|uniref:hypothetical protein n=1 Tax=Halorubellus sp. JP-L1 TaxID=2715753 RepID=UPI00140DDB0F|nr:hypothetical protein [Halorubellus sp. JP-L1]NHN43200.1 hypothetical protein [Halorubellus sp. JP-L1]
MKKGSGDDPFADLDEDESDADDSTVEPPESSVEDGSEADSSEESGSSTTERYTDLSGASGDEGPSNAAASGVDTGGSSSGADTGGSSSGVEQSKAEADGIPWVLRRSRVKEDRENVHQFFLREEYSTREDEILEAVAGELDMRQKDLQKLDVREAMVAAAEPEAIADVLREWGYEYLK